MSETAHNRGNFLNWRNKALAIGSVIVALAGAGPAISKAAAPRHETMKGQKTTKGLTTLQRVKNNLARYIEEGIPVPVAKTDLVSRDGESIPISDPLVARVGRESIFFTVRLGPEDKQEGSLTRDTTVEALRDYVPVADPVPVQYSRLYYANGMPFAPIVESKNEPVAVAVPVGSEIGLNFQ